MTAKKAIENRSTGGAAAQKTARARNFMNKIAPRRFLKFLPLLILISSGLGCAMMETVESTKIPQSEITQTYVVNATRENTSVSAYFNHGSWGKSVDLDAPSRIEHNGVELSQSTLTFLLGTSYETRLAGAPTVHSFVYTNNDGQVFRNELSFDALEPPAGEIAIGRARETEIRLSRPVGDDESVEISLNSLAPQPAPDNSKPAAEEYAISLSGELDRNRSAIVLKPKNLKRFAGGKAVLTIAVSRALPLQQATPAGGTMRWSYSATRTAILAD